MNEVITHETAKASPVQENVHCFSFETENPVSDAEPVSGMDFLNLGQCYSNGQWYEPPIIQEGLARLFQISPHHSSAIFLKRNLLSRALKPNKYLSRQTFAAMVQDFLVFGNAYCELITNRMGDLLQIKHAPAIYTRRGVNDGEFFWTPLFNQFQTFLNPVLQIKQPDINQEIYGVPEYLGALHSLALNHSATLFRIRYYKNGSHAGFILFMSGTITDKDADQIQQELQNSKGRNNFKNLFLHSPNGKKGDVQLIPITEVGAKDEFINIKNVTRDDILAAHRVPPQLLGMVPPNGSGFGDVSKATSAFYQLEIEPLMSVFSEINEMVGRNIIDFELPSTQ